MHYYNILSLSLSLGVLVIIQLVEGEEDILQEALVSMLYLELLTTGFDSE